MTLQISHLPDGQGKAPMLENAQKFDYAKRAFKKSITFVSFAAVSGAAALPT